MKKHVLFFLILVLLLSSFFAGCEKGGENADFGDNGDQISDGHDNDGNEMENSSETPDNSVASPIDYNREEKKYSLLYHDGSILIYGQNRVGNPLFLDSGMLKDPHDRRGSDTRITFIYDDKGKMTSISMASVQGEFETQIIPLSAAEDRPGVLVGEGFEIVATGNKISVIEMSGWSIVLDDHGRVARLEEGGTIAWSYLYSGDDILVDSIELDATVTITLGKHGYPVKMLYPWGEYVTEYTWEYDVKERVVSYFRGKIGEKYAYDENGNRITETYFRGDVVTEEAEMRYTKDGKILEKITKKYNDEGVYLGKNVIAWEYDEDGSLLNKTQFEYDELGNLIWQN